MVNTLVFEYKRGGTEKKKVGSVGPEFDYVSLSPCRRGDLHGIRMFSCLHGRGA